MTPRFSVIIPVRNGAALLGATLDCLRAQTYGQWEAVVIDDGSIDETRTVAEAVAEVDSRVRVVHQPPSGVSAARNHGLHEAQFEWIHFLDGDDLLNPRFYEHVAHALVAQPKADGANTAWVRMLPDGRLFDEIRAEAFPDLFDVAARYCPFAIHTCIVRRTQLLDAGGFDESLRTCEDWDLWARLARAGLRLVPVGDALAVYRIRTGSASLDGRQLVRDGLHVIDITHGADPRVPRPLPALARGRDRASFPTIQYDVTVWAAGLMVGQGLDPSALLDELGPVRHPTLDPESIAIALQRAEWITSLGEPLWTRWARASKLLRPFLEQIEETSGTAALAARVELRLARLAADECRAAGPVVIGPVLARPLDVEAPLIDIEVPAGVERVRLRAEAGGEVVGHVEVPATSGSLPAAAVREAVLRQVAWPLLAQLLERQRPPSTRRATPSTRAELVRALWAAPPIGNRSAGQVAIDGRPVAIELSTFTGRIESDTAAVEVDVTLGGVPVVGLVLEPERGRVTAEQLRATVVRWALTDLARAAVSTAVIERPIDDGMSLAERLAAASRVPHPPALAVRRLRVRLVPGWHRTWQAHAPTPATRARALAQRLPPVPRQRVKALHTRLVRLPGRLGSLVPDAGSRGIPVLMYHRVAPQGSALTSRWRVAPAQFDEHLDALRQAGYQGVSLEALRRAWYDGVALPRRPVVLTFDDGYTDFAEHAWPRLATRGWRATIFAVSDAVGRTNAWDHVYEDPVSLMDWSTLRELAAGGVELGSHSVDHPTLTSLAPEQVLAQATGSRQRIEDETGAPVRSFAYPYGDTDEAVADLVAAAGYSLAVTCESGPVTGNADPLLLPRVEVKGTTTARAGQRTGPPAQLTGRPRSPAAPTLTMIDLDSQARSA